MIATAEEAVADILEGASLAVGGFGLAGVPNVLIRAMYERGVGGWAKCTLPLTGKGCVDRVVTDRGVLEVTAGGLVLVGTAPGVTAAEITAATDAALTLAEPLDEGPKEPKEQQ